VREDGGVEATAHEALEEARTMLAQASRVTVFTGAGISTDSGIPDYRGPNGLWTTHPKAEKMSSLSHYLADHEVRQLAWQNRMHSPAWGAVPNAGHYSLVKLEERGVLVALVTQNIDELHQAAGHNPQHVVEVHGTMRYSRCWGCGDRRPMQEILVRVRAGEVDPSCHLCSGILKSDTISFGQSLVPEVIERAMTASENCDVLLAVGSSLSVYPAANVVPRAKAAGARIIIINGEPTKMDQYADVVIVGNIGDVLPAVIG
jgi:NAD-dependent deacetylase